MGTAIKHIPLSGKLWMLRRRIKNKSFNLRRYIYEWCRKTLYRLQHPREAKQTRDSIYLIYTMGKVASMSVLDAVTGRLPHVPVFAMHYLSEANLRRQEEQLGNSAHWDNQLYRKIHTLHARKIRNCIAKHPQNHIRIITLVREPLNQIISQIFQQLNLHDIESLKRMTAGNRQVDYDYPANWCCNELAAFSGIDILNEPFNPHKGYAIYHKDNFSVLVIRFEDINRVFQEAMSSYSGVGRWLLREKNKAENKQYANEYKAFKRELEIESAVLDKVYSSPFVQHFYTEEEIQRFREKWEKLNINT